MDKLLLLDRAISVLMGLLNLLGTSKVVSDIIAKRISERRSEWTDEERQLVEDDLKASKAYAKAELAKPD